MSGRKTAALLVSDIENGYANTLCAGAMEASRRLDINLIICPGQSIQAPYGTLHQYNVIYDTLKANRVDGVVIAAGNLANFIPEDDFRRFYEEFSPAPLVGIGMPLPGYPSVLVDNRKGFSELIDHLIRDHGRRRLAFISGPETNVEARDRLEVYYAVLKRHGMVPDPALFYNGNFMPESGEAAIELLIDKRRASFDALVVANDDMALEAIRALKKRGLRVPEDVSVIGFDNISSTVFSDPPLSTVHQPVYQQVLTAFDLLAQSWSGQVPTDNILLTTTPVLRRSCGCHQTGSRTLGTGSIHEETTWILSRLVQGWETGETATEVLRALNEAARIQGEHPDHALKSQKALEILHRDVVEGRYGENQKELLTSFLWEVQAGLLSYSLEQNARRWDIHSQDINLLREVLQTLVSSVHSVADGLKAIIEPMQSAGIVSAYIYLYEDEILHTRSDSWQIPPTVSRSLAFNTSQPQIPPRVIVSAELLKDALEPNRSKTLFILPLFFGDAQQGLLLCETSLSDSYLLKTLAMELSSALKLARLIELHRVLERKLYETMADLEAYNRKLDTLSQTDELTGLYNRRGFLNLAQQGMYLARRMNKGGLIVFADMDGLKAINDNWGHEEGDEAIRTMARLLTKAFRNNDLLARLGGDEFVVFTVDATLAVLETLKERLQEFLKEFNTTAKKPYQLSITLGAVEFHHTQNITVQNLLEQADTLLYEQKRNKKSHG